MANSILLINPPFINYPLCTPPLGISYIKAYTQMHNNLSVKCLDLSLKFLENLKNEEKLIKFIEKYSIYFENNSKFDMSLVRKTPLYIDQALGNINDKTKFNNTSIYKESLRFLFYVNDTIITQIIEIASNEISNDDDIASEFIDLLAFNEISESNPTTVGFSVMFENQLLGALFIQKILNRFLPHVITVFGGALFSFLDSDESKKILDIKYGPDYLVIGDGEVAFQKILQKATNLNKHGIKEKQIISEAIPENLDTLPFPDYSDFDLTKYHTPEIVLPILGSRGCYWGKCTFCTYDNNFLLNNQNRTCESIIEELEYNISLYGCRFFSFSDSGISFNKLYDLSEKIENHNLNIYYECMCRPEKSFTVPQELKVLSRSGLTQVSFGVESFTQRLLNLMNKGTSANAALKTIISSKKEGIESGVFYIVGFPSQTWDELLNEIKIILNNINNMSWIAVNSFALLRGAPILKNKKMADLFSIKKEKAFTLVKIQECTIYQDNIDFEYKGELKRNDARMWANILDELTYSIKSLTDPYHRYVDSHRLIRTVKTETIHNQSIYHSTTEGDVSFDFMYYNSDSNLNRIKEMIQYLEENKFRDFITISFIIANLRSKLRSYSNLSDQNKNMNMEN